MRLRRKIWTEEAVREFDGFVFSKSRAKDMEFRGKWFEIFGRTAPIFIELGAGKGDFITEMAARNASSDFIGIEAEESILYTAAKKVKESGLKNVRLIVYDAAEIGNLFAQGEACGLYINFCDPWPKKRHAKRRLTNRNFLRNYRQILKPNSRLIFKTDGAPLFDYSIEEFETAGLQILNATHDYGADDEKNVETEYEKKFRALGEKICRAEVLFP